MRRWTATIGLVVCLLLPGPAEAQVLRAAAGAGGGAAAGIVVTMGWLVQRATFEERYLHSAGDLIGAAGAPLLVGPALGVALALGDADRFRAAGIGAGAGTLFGAALGAGLGELLAGDRTSRWAGGVMGAARAS